MKSEIPPNNWKEWTKNWVPAIFLTLYRRIRRHRSASLPPRQFNLPTLALDELFPGIDSTMLNIEASVLHDNDVMVLPLRELLTLAALCKHVEPRRIFEIGTYAGLSTLVMAMNTPEQSEIFTLDLEPPARETHQHGLGTGGFTAFTVGAYYSNTLFAGKVQQLFGNSRIFDYSAFNNTIDLVFVDADHSYDFVKVDTANAFNLLSSHGIIIWDDYIWDERHPECAGVARCIHELQQFKGIYRIAGTRFAIYRPELTPA